MTGSVSSDAPSSAIPSTPTPVDCAAFGSRGVQVCDTGLDYCGVVFADGAGCTVTCAIAGLTCAAGYENLEDQCGADTSRAAVGCDSGHESDYCRCESSGSTPAPGANTSDIVEPSEPAETTETPPTPAPSSGMMPTPNASGSAPCAVPDYISLDTAPVGWASQSGGTSGGGSATPVLVTSFSQLQNEVRDSTPRVVYVQGELSTGDLDVGSNKTIIGCSPGAHLHGSVSIGSGSANIVVRNLTISGYAVGDCALDPSFDSGTGCSSGKDAVAVNGDAHHVWFDHCLVKDGTDGNLDITNDADFVTVSWSKFMYTPRQDNVGEDSTGAAGHRFSNLVGGTDSAPTGWPQRVPLNVTWHHNWWADGVVERQPRVRYGRNHLFNNYYNSSVSNYCVRAGIEASVLLQGNYFDGVKSPHQFNSDSNQQTAYIALGGGTLENRYDGVSGDRETGGGGDTFEPPYPFEVDAPDGVPSAVVSGAGPH